MLEGADKLWRGDVLIFQGEKVVASFKGIVIQGVPRRVLKVILSIESGNGSKSQKQPAVQKKEPTSLTVPTVSHVSRNAAPVSEEQDGSKIAQALSIIAEESGITVTDMTDNTVFSDVGIDSLLGLTISARFKEEIDVNLDFNSLFYEYPTVRDVKTLLGGSKASATLSTTEAITLGTNTPGSGTTTPRSGITGATTPVVDEDSLDVNGVDF